MQGMWVLIVKNDEDVLIVKKTKANLETEILKSTELILYHPVVNFH